MKWIVFTFLKWVGVSIFLLTATVTHAAEYLSGPADYIYSPRVEEGEREIDTKFGTQTPRTAGDPRQSGASIGFGYGVTSWWFTEIYGKNTWDGNNSQFDAIEWENKFQLTETGKYFVDVGFLLELERPQNRNEGYEAKYGFLLQKDWNKWQANLNLLMQGHYTGTENQGTYFGYQGQLKYRLQPELELGAQLFSWLGQLNSWNTNQQQQTSVGPAIFGKTKLGRKEALVYNFAYLWGTTTASPKNTIRMQVEYEF
ncbi:hypothetical protein A8O14_10300 [Polynucleobacter wuianus]|uniref:Outer membrane protein beta-barrel domain-containing protein n=1 Tax=Polynucleobacter wuianus TaxID=1743168 RepID=A0A191UHD8_9BURK|nr:MULTISPECIES: hypothetical protein [Polynucleobacter]ANJ00430.1 hypothetical protein A8O14_10300 [Polynucleobacter wuianus]